LASAPAPKHGDKRAEQPIAAANPCLTRTIELTTISLAPLKWLSVGRTGLPSRRQVANNHVPRPSRAVRSHPAQEDPPMSTPARRFAFLFALALAAPVAAEPGPAWKSHEKPWLFLFGNHLDTHQQSKLKKDGGLEGYLYVRHTGAVSDDGYRVATHVDCDAVGDGKKDGCVAGWKFEGRPGAAHFLYHAPMDHPFWHVPRSGIPQPGAHGHFHWTGTPPTAEALPDGKPDDYAWQGFFLQLEALDTFCFVHHAHAAGGTCSAQGGVIVTKGLDLATHLNLVPAMPAD
jgi:hypothetical protein